MVNVKNLFGMAVMATALVGCSSNDNLAPDGKDNVGKTGEAYASFKINLPTTTGTGTRGEGDPAQGTPSFENGDKNEYAVKDATLILFKKNDSGDFVFKQVVDLGNMEPWTSSDANGITTTAKLTAKITNAEVGANKGYYALIVLNNNSGTAAKISYPSENQTYAAWSQNADNATAANYLKYDNGFFMANAPKYVAGAPETLVEIKNIYASKQQAENSTATTVYVERGLAKVSLATGSESKHVDITEGNYKNDQVDITGWTLDVTNTKTFPVHVTDGLWADTWKTATTPAAGNGATMDRFHDTNTEFPRVYWGLDPNYKENFTSVDACEKEFTMATKGSFKTGDEAKKAQYCLENTFDIDHMVQGQTTRVLFSAKYKPANFADGETFYKFGNSPKLWHEADVVAQIKAKAQEVLGEADADKVTVTLAAEGNDMTEAGVRLVAAANITYGTTALKTEQVDQINTKLGFKKATSTDAAVGLSTFKSGVSYYIARVKHFNALTPWNPGDKTYDGNNANWLGRYGVLRNNWYELSVSSVSGPGYPDVPKVNPTDPDDENKQFINVEVKILKWAKRSQQVEL
ncbi:Mfa1 family fimbria major subunit [uncultured Prevotella sp.]|uniref:Mfa1 family fimbria major subunit n=1 Tax=uncultured Prevotella sp. TaxID=159272 RepID=UPI00260E3A38|nr:Mfa1 family fimbria major subunit [uncultured Prevotella sp.]